MPVHNFTHYRDTANRVIRHDGLHELLYKQTHELSGAYIQPHGGGKKSSDNFGGIWACAKPGLPDHPDHPDHKKFCRYILATHVALISTALYTNMGQLVTVQSSRSTIILVEDTGTEPHPGEAFEL